MILIAPIKTEKAVGKMEFDNTIVFEVDMKATKQQIKSEVEKRFAVKVAKINTYLTAKGKKHALVKLAAGSKADEVAMKLKVA